MGVRIIALSLLLTLTGCTTNWFGSGDNDAPASNNQIGNIGAETPFSQEGLAQALGDDYHLRSGMGMKDGQLFSFFQALKEVNGQQELAQTIYGKYDTGIVRVEVFETGVSTGEASVGTPFSAVYEQAFGACYLDEETSEQELVCKSEQNPYVSYVFSGEWSGPKTLIPDNEVLKEWTVSKIIWDRSADVQAQPAASTEQPASASENKPAEEIDEIAELVNSLETANG